MNKFLTMILMTMMVLGLNACSAESGPDEASTSAAQTAAKLAYEREIKKYRNERLERLQLPAGWLSLARPAAVTWKTSASASM